MLDRLNRLPASQCKNALLRLSEKAKYCKLSGRILSRAIVELENKSAEFYEDSIYEM